MGNRQADISRESEGRGIYPHPHFGNFIVDSGRFGDSYDLADPLNTIVTFEIIENMLTSRDLDKESK